MLDNAHQTILGTKFRKEGSLCWPPNRLRPFGDDVNVPFFDYPALMRTHEAEFRQAVDSVLERGAFILQTDLADFERELAAYCGAGAAVGVGNCTDALTIALAALGIGRGDEVITSSHTFVATASAIVRAGATPVFADIGHDHLMTVEAVEAALSPRTAALMPVSINGRCCELGDMSRLAQQNGLAIIEDSAQALGASIEGKQAGTFGEFGTFSFYPAKNLGAFGDAGAIVTSDLALADFASKYRDHGRNNETGEIDFWGVNSRLDNLQAAVLSVQLRHYAANIGRRREIAARYHEGLQDLEGLVLPPPPEDPRRFDTFQNYEVEADARDDLRAHLADSGVSTILQWGGKAVHHFEALKVDAELPNTDRLFQRMFLLPMNQLLTDDQVTYVIDQVRRFFSA